MKMNAHVLGIDPGAQSGAALLAPDSSLVFAEEVGKRDAAKRGELVRKAVLTARSSQTDLVVIREKWQPGGWERGKRHGNASMLMGLGVAWGLWLEELYLHASELPFSRYHTVVPPTWRKHVLGVGASSRDGWERVTAQYVRNRWGVEPGPNASVACCVAAFAFLHTKTVACVQSKPLWHRKAPQPPHGAGTETQLADAQRRIAELEAIIAERTLADVSLGDGS